jgi:hypothetical protein
VLRAHPNPPLAAQAARETGAVRNLASVAAVIAVALPESDVRHGPEESGLTLPSKSQNPSNRPRKINHFRARTLLDGDEDTGSLALAYHAHDVVSGSELLSIHCFVEVGFGFALEQNHRGR